MVRAHLGERGAQPRGRSVTRGRHQGGAVISGACSPVMGSLDLALSTAAAVTCLEWPSSPAVGSSRPTSRDPGCGPWPKGRTNSPPPRAL